MIPPEVVMESFSFLFSRHFFFLLCNLQRLNYVLGSIKINKVHFIVLNFFEWKPYFIYPTPDFEEYNFSPVLDNRTSCLLFDFRILSELSFLHLKYVL